MVDLLDYDVRFGQGFLFSPPRPVRTEALQGKGDGAMPAGTRQRRSAARRSGSGDPGAKRASPPWAWWRNAASRPTKRGITNR